jgi:class 3 adenylate cyclase
MRGGQGSDADDAVPSDGGGADVKLVTAEEYRLAKGAGASHEAVSVGAAHRGAPIGIGWLASDPKLATGGGCELTQPGGARVALQNAKLEGEVREVSVLMADLRGFTACCERVTPRRMAAVLNDYLATMTDVIWGRYGLVQDFVGDGILSVFGAPFADTDHAWQATMTALEMQAAMGVFGSRWQREVGSRLALGVAVHSGEAFVGPVGSPRLKKYAAVGDRVNTVARLEELNRELGTAILISGETRARLGARIEVWPRGSFQIRGRSRPIEVFEVLGAPVGPDRLGARQKRQGSTSQK